MSTEENKTSEFVDSENGPSEIRNKEELHNVNRNTDERNKRLD